jgi:glycerol uptake facilitator-like aquaporin
VVAQLIGAMLGAFLAISKIISFTEDEGGKLACFAQVQLSNYYSNLISEIIGTFV